MYVWIFLSAYAAALVLTLSIISLRAKSQANRLISRGIPKQEIDLFYREVGARARRALIQGTLIIGTCIGVFGSLIAWVATR